MIPYGPFLSQNTYFSHLVWNASLYIEQLITAEIYEFFSYHSTNRPISTKKTITILKSQIFGISSAYSNWLTSNAAQTSLIRGYGYIKKGDAPEKQLYRLRLKIP